MDGGNSLGLGLVFSAQDAASGVIQRVGKGLLDTVGATSAAGKAIRSYFKEFSVGMGLFGAGAAGLSMLAPALRETSEYGKAIALVATESDEAVFSTKKMREVTMGLAADFGKLPKDQATSLYEAVGMGANTAAKATNLLTGASRLAVAGNADLKTSTDALGGALRAYGADWSQAGAYADTIFVAMTSGKTTVQELAGSLGRVTSMSASLGLSFEETTAAIAAMTSTGIEANMAVTGLHGAFANILHPEAHAGAEAARLGIKFDSVTLKSKGLMGLLQSITGAKGFQGVESIKRLFPSIEGFNAVMQITAGNMGGFKSALDAMKDKSGAAAKGFEIMARTSAFQEDRMKALKSTALILIGEAIEPLAASALRFGNMVLEAFIKIPAPVRDFMVRAFAVAAVLLTVVGGAIAAKAAFGILSAGASALGITFSGVLATVAPVLVAFALVGLAVAAFRTAYEHNIGGFATFVNGVYAKVSLFVRALGQLFEDGAFSGAVLDELDKSDGGVEHFAIRVWGAVQRIINFWDHLVDAFVGGIQANEGTFREFGRAIERLADVFGVATDSIDGDKAAGEFDAWGSAGSRMGRIVADVAATLVDDLTRVLSVLTGFAEKWERISAATGPVAKDISLVRDAVKELTKALDGNSDATQDNAYRWMMLGGKIGSVVGGLVDGVMTIYSAVAGVFRGIITIWTGAVGIIRGIANGDWAEVVHGMAQLFYGLFTAVQSAVSGIVRVIASAIDTLGRVFGKEFGAKAALDGFLKNSDTAIRMGLGLDTYESAGDRAGREGSEARARANHALASAGAFASYNEPSTSLLSEPAPAAAAALYATTEAMRSGGVDAEAIGGAVAAAVSSAPMSIAPARATMMMDGQVVGELVTQYQRGDGISSEVPMSIPR